MSTPEIVWKEGDWVLHEFQICQVTKVHPDGCVGRVSDGRFERCGSDLRADLVPLTLRNKAISEEFEYHHKALHALERTNLNYPRIKDWLVEEWRRVTNLPEDSENLFRGVREFVAKVKEQVEAVRQVQLDGVQLFR